ncbi:MAG: hypothetical protein ACKVQA_23465 [Burkholderiales bacterium]
MPNNPESTAPAALRTGPARGIALFVVVAVLLAVAGYALMRETRKAPAPSAQSAPVGHEMGHSERPPMSADEERYAHGLWQVHDKVRTSAVKMSFAGLSYKMGDTDKAAMREKIAPLTKVFSEAQGQLAQLKVPESLQALHKDYTEVLRLYREASAEMAKSADGDQHLIVAQSMSEKASTLLLKVGDVLWPGEYKPN